MRKRKWCVPPTVIVVGEWGWGGGGGRTSRGCYMAVGLVGWLVGLCWRVGDAWRRWSHMCRSWYLPRFCLGGSYTWMNIASLMVLEWLLTSLCIILNWLGSMGCPVVVLWMCIGEGALKCSLTLSPKVLPDSPIYIYVGALVMIYDSCLVWFGVFVLWVS